MLEDDISLKFPLNGASRIGDGMVAVAGDSVPEIREGVRMELPEHWVVEDHTIDWSDALGTSFPFSQEPQL